VRDASGEVLYRVKLKEEKFNVYDGQGARVRHGKVKGGAVVVRDAAGATVLTITGARDLGRAGLLATPIPDLPRALFWMLAADTAEGP
jgi:hypothetical protein